MQDIALTAEDILLTHPHPALRLGELKDLLTERGCIGLTGERLRTVLEASPDRFRIIPTWRRRWPVPPGAPPSVAAEPWILCIAEPRDTGGRRPPGATERLRASVHWLGRTVDTRSVLEVGRWYAIALAEREARRLVARRRAEHGPPGGVERRAS